MKSLSLNEKINLILEFHSQFGEPIVGNTVYKGYEIGKMAILLRYELKKGKCKLSEEQLSKLQAIGVLDSQIDTIDEKVDRLENFVKKYPDLWIDRKNSDNYLESISDIEERERIRKELESANASYEYIISRHYRRKLAQKYYVRLKEAGVGGAFGYKEEISDENDRIMNEYGISQDVLDQIIRRYGSIGKFREKYIQGLISDNFQGIPKDLISRAHLITDFDLSSPDLVCRENEYTKLYRELFGLEDRAIIIDKIGIENELEYKLNIIPRREALVVSKTFGLRGEKPQKLDAISPELGISKQTVSAIKLKAMRKLSARIRPINLEEMIFLTDNDRDAFIRKYFSKYDIFYKESPEPIDESFKEELLEIVVMNKIRNACKIDYDEFVSKYLNNDYIGQIIENRNNLELTNLRTKASSLLQQLKRQIEDVRVLDEKSKERIYNNLYKTTDLVRIMIEANYEQTESETEYEATTRYFGSIEEIIDKSFDDNNEKKEELLNALKARKDIIIKRNKAYLKSLLTGEYDSDDYIDENGKKQKILGMNIEELDLTVRCYNALNRRGIKTVYDWLILTDEEKQKIRNLGVKSMDEMEGKMLELGVSSNDVGIQKDSSVDISEVKMMILRQIDELYLDDSTKEELHRLFDYKFNNPEVWKNEKMSIIKKILKLREHSEKQDMDDYSGVPIEELDLTIRSYGSLKKSGINTVEQYTMLTQEEKLSIGTLGVRGIEQIDRCIAELGKNLNEKRKNEIRKKIDEASLKDDDKKILIDFLNGGELPDDFISIDDKNEDEVDGENDDLDLVLEDSIEQLRKTYEAYNKMLVELRNKKIELKRRGGLCTSRLIDAITEEQKRLRAEQTKIKEKLDRLLGDD